jgi:hypothetical protein
MNTTDLQQKLSLTHLAGGDEPRELDGCYIGDLLSWVMGRAGEANVWITVMGNINSIAVAKLADIGCIVLCEDAPLDEEARQRADVNGIPVYSSSLPAYPLALKVEEFLCGKL